VYRSAILLTMILLLGVSVSWTGFQNTISAQIPGVTDALFFQYRLVARDFLDRRCNFTPSCSHYGQLAISRFGPVLGTMVALERWTRCHSSARGLDYYTRDEETQTLWDPVDTGEGNVVWDSLLLPF